MKILHSILVFLVLNINKIGSSSVLTKVVADSPETVENNDFDSLVHENEFAYENRRHSMEYPLERIENDIKSEALIKKIHPFIYPKHYNTLEAIDSTNVSVLTGELEKTPHEENTQRKNERIDDYYGPIDQQNSVDRNSLHHASQKHAHSYFDSFDRPTHQSYTHAYPINHHNKCALGGLHLVDPLFLMAVLGFLAYIINSVVSLVDRINLPLLNPAMSSSMTVGTSASTKSAIPFDVLREKSPDTNQHLLKDFERILQMAIDAYEQKTNSKLLN